MTRWLADSRLPFVIALVGLGAGALYAVHFAATPDHLLRLISTEAILVIAFGLLLALALRQGRLRRQVAASEQRLHDIAVASGNWLWETGPDLRFTYLSANFAEASGQDPARVLGRSGAELHFGQDVPQRWRHRLAEPVHPRPFRDHIFTVVLPSREPFVFKASGVPVFDTERRFLGYRGIAKDITALMLAERDTRRLEADLYRAQRMEALGVFAGGVAHDVNNALSPILTVIRSMMRRLEDRPREHESLALAFEAAQRCRDLVSGLLALIRREQAADRAIDLKGPVADAISVLRKSLPRNIRLVTEIEPVPMPVISAPIKILQIVASLVDNASQAIGETAATGEITLRLAAAADLDGYLIEVIDDGPGIPAALHGKIFEPFFTTKTAEVGTGLGLTTVHSLARGLGGRVSVVSRPDHGAKFIVFLPRATADVMEANLADAPNSEKQQS